MISTSYSPDPAYVLTRIEDIKALDAEIERLQDAKRRALAIADERAKENVALRVALKPFADYADPRNGVPPSFQITAGSPLARKQLLMQDCYRARDALTHEQSASGEVRR